MPFRRHTLGVLAADLLLVALAWQVAFWLRFNLDVPPEFGQMAWSTAPIPLALFGLVLVVTRVPRQVWRFVGLHELRQLARAVAVAGLLAAAAVLMLRVPQFPRSVLLLHPLIALALMAAARAAQRSFHERRESVPGGRRILVVGTLQEAAEALRVLKGSQQWLPVGIVSPLADQVGRTLQDVRVLGTLEEIGDISKDEDVQAVLVASAPGSPARRDALLHVDVARMTLLTLPRPDQWIQGDGTAPRRIELEDLLGRAAVQLDVAGLSAMVSGQTVLVTGAGGSIGSELCRQIARLGAARLVCVDISEFAIYQLEQELQRAHPQLRGAYYTANVREGDRLDAIAAREQPSVVFHAAAYKHVPLMEENPQEAVKTNILGTHTMARLASEHRTECFVMVSTDKAVNPTNIMGASKRAAEHIVNYFNDQPGNQTRFVTTRFGNVLGSNGSVIPLFKKQLQDGGPITLTHKDITRYFMTIPEAVRLVLEAGHMGQGGEILVFDMGEPVKIYDLAVNLIKLSGLTVGKDIQIVVTGLRPGEKLYEELLADGETTRPTHHRQIFISTSNNLDPKGVEALVEAAKGADKGWLEYITEYEKAVH